MGCGLLAAVGWDHNMVFDGDLPTEDFHLISSCPCWAYRSKSGSGHDN